MWLQQPDVPAQLGAKQTNSTSPYTKHGATSQRKYHFLDIEMDLQCSKDDGRNKDMMS